MRLGYPGNEAGDHGNEAGGGLGMKLASKLSLVASFVNMYIICEESLVSFLCKHDNQNRFWTKTEKQHFVHCSTNYAFNACCV